MPRLPRPALVALLLPILGCGGDGSGPTPVTMPPGTYDLRRIDVFTLPHALYKGQGVLPGGTTPSTWTRWLLEGRMEVQPGGTARLVLLEQQRYDATGVIGGTFQIETPFEVSGTDVCEQSCAANVFRKPLFTTGDTIWFRYREKGTSDRNPRWKFLRR